MKKAPKKAVKKQVAAKKTTSAKKTASVAKPAVKAATPRHEQQSKVIQFGIIFMFVAAFVLVAYVARYYMP